MFHCGLMFCYSLKATLCNSSISKYNKSSCAILAAGCMMMHQVTLLVCDFMNTTINLILIFKYNKIQAFVSCVFGGVFLAARNTSKNFKPHLPSPEAGHHPLVSMEMFLHFNEPLLSLEQVSCRWCFSFELY